MNRRHARGSEHVRLLAPIGCAFRGFGAALPALDQRFGRAGIRGGEPRVEVGEDAVSVPSEHHRVKGRSQFYGGIVAADAKPVDAAQARRRRETTRPGG